MDNTKPYFPAFERFQTNGDEIMGAVGSTATAFYTAGLKVFGTREQGWTACSGGTAGVNRGGLNGTGIVATFLSDSSANLTTGVLALATFVYESRKTIAALQLALERQGVIGTTIA